MKALTIIGISSLLLGSASLAPTLWELYRLRGDGLGAVAGGGTFFLLVPLGLLLLVIALVLRIRTGR